jgi:hypothetical protein
VNTPRLTLPTLVTGVWDSLLICTYGARLDFLEHNLWRQIERVPNRIILADAQQVQRHLRAREGGALRHVNRAYVLGTLVSKTAAHAKLIMLLREDAGILAIGSGNLSFDGYASQGECFTVYHWSPDKTQGQGEFAAVREFVDELVVRNLVDSIVAGRIHQAWQDAPWLFGTVSASRALVRHNLTTPLIDQFIEALEGETVENLTVHAPFYDRRCDALEAIIRRSRPKRVHILLQEKMTAIDPDELTRVMSASCLSWEARSVQAPETGTFLHAKFLIAELRARSVCLQGSPNCSGPALLRTHPTGNVELANLIPGPPRAFDHLVRSLVVSDAVDVHALGLRWARDEGEEVEARSPELVKDLVWRPPCLTGTFLVEIAVPPVLLVGDRVVDDVDWKLEPAVGGFTPFTIKLGEQGSSLLIRTEVVTFDFGANGTSAPQYPYHLNDLLALASGQVRADLLRTAGDFDIPDEELELLLAELDHALIVDVGSIWRMLKKKRAPEPNEDEDGPHLAWEDLNWDALQSHPKFAQYHGWDKQGSTDLTALGILLTSIAERFPQEVAASRGEAVPGVHPGAQSGDDRLGDLSVSPQGESEAEAERAALEQEELREAARLRASKQFERFINRFVDGLTDPEFVKFVGPTVILPSYVIFNHICWKLAKLDLAPEPSILDAQLALWTFFWGDGHNPGYLARLGEPEQEAALELMDRHHAEAVLLASLIEAQLIGRQEVPKQLPRLRDLWRAMLTNHLLQPTRKAIGYAAAVAGEGPESLSKAHLVDELDRLGHYYTGIEARAVIAAAVHADPNLIWERKGEVVRGHLGMREVKIYEVDDNHARLTPATATEALRGLTFPGVDYLRISHPASKSFAEADFALNRYRWHDGRTKATQELNLCGREPWERELEYLRRMAA